MSINKTIFFLIFIFMLSNAGIANAETATAGAVIQAGVSDNFEIAFYTDANVLYSTSIPFTNINPAQSMSYADLRYPGDGKADTGIMCQSNMGVTWYLKMSVTTASSPAFPLDQFKFYMGQPWSNVLGGPADGALTYPLTWNSVPQDAVTIYTAGDKDMNNYGYGTLATLSFALTPEGLLGGNAYVVNITYTITITP